MSDIRFACPRCQQHIRCELGYAGREIACPTCSSRMIVPRPAGAPPPPAPSVPAPAPALHVAAASAPSPAPIASAPVAATQKCPHCGAEISARSIMCIKCRVNLRTGEPMTVPSRPAGFSTSARTDGAAGAVVSRMKPGFYPGILGAIFVGLYVFAWTRPEGFLFYLGFLFLYDLAVYTMVVVTAFKQDPGSGVLCFCIPVYQIYFVYFKSRNFLLKMLFSLSLIMTVALFTIKRFD